MKTALITIWGTHALLDISATDDLQMVFVRRGRLGHCSGNGHHARMGADSVNLRR